jgi:bacterioferritin-associated ferredoxin
MIVCECRGLTDAQIRALVRAGWDTLPLLETVCGVGASCGDCRQALAAMLDQETMSRREAASKSSRSA